MSDSSLKITEHGQQGGEYFRLMSMKALENDGTRGVSQDQFGRSRPQVHAEMTTMEGAGGLICTVVLELHDCFRVFDSFGVHLSTQDGTSKQPGILLRLYQKIYLIYDKKQTTIENHKKH